MIRAGWHAAAIGLWICMFAAVLAAPARAEITVKEVTSPSGITAWLVEDYTVPIVTVRFAFRGGSRADPEGKSGLAYLMSGLMVEGAGQLEAAAFQTALDDTGLSLSFFADVDHFGASLRVMQPDIEPAFDLLKIAVQEPRFDPEPLERVRKQVMSILYARDHKPDARANRAMQTSLYGAHPGVVTLTRPGRNRAASAPF